MTDPTESERDELASAILDGEATDAERARADADPEVARRVEQLRAVSIELGAPSDLDDETRASLIAQALAAATAADPAPGAASTPANVTSLEGRRTRPSARLNKIASVAAIVIALLAVPALLIGLNRNSGVHDTATAVGGADASYDAETAGDAQADTLSSTTFSPVGAPIEGSGSAAAPSASSLGSVDTEDELEASVHSVLAADDERSDGQDSSNPPTTEPTTTTELIVPDPAPNTFGAVGACEAAVRAELMASGFGAFGDLVLHRTVEFRGVPSEVYAFDSLAGSTVLATLVEQGSCAPIYTWMPPT